MTSLDGAQCNTFISLLLHPVACSLGQDTGSCQDYTMMWFFDSSQRSCFPFWYGGCGGNENRFKTKEDCEKVCLTKG